jgi:hypothetical protein
MGIHQRKFIGTVDPNLVCSVCREVFDIPVRTSTCGHVFCQQCVGEWLRFGNENCPECRKALKESDISVDRLLSSLIGNLIAHCPNGKEHQEKKALEDDMFRETVLKRGSPETSLSRQTNSDGNKSTQNSSSRKCKKKSLVQNQKTLSGQPNERPAKRRRKGLSNANKNTNTTTTTTTTTTSTAATPKKTSNNIIDDTKSKNNNNKTTLPAVNSNEKKIKSNENEIETGVTEEEREVGSFCSWTGKYSELENHVNSCRHEKVTCTHNEFGCKFIGKRYALVEHLQFQCVFHKVKNILYSQKKIINETKEKLQDLESQNAHLETILLAQTGSWLKEIQVGTKLDAKDKFGRWYEGTVIAMHGADQVRIHFDGWNSNFDELMVKSSERLAPLHLHSIKRKNKRKAQRKFRDFEDGDIIDCKDTMGDWYESAVLDIKDGQVLIHYEGWPNVWDEWIDKSSNRLAPYRTHSLRGGAAHARFLYSQQQQHQNLMQQRSHYNFIHSSRSWF